MSERRVTCHTCGKSVSRQADLARHMRTHNSNKEQLMHACSMCSYKTLQLSNLKTHMNVHTGAKPHKCPTEGCTFETSDPGSLTRHRKARHAHDTGGPRKNKSQVSRQTSRRQRRAAPYPTPSSSNATTSSNSPPCSEAPDAFETLTGESSTSAATGSNSMSPRHDQVAYFSELVNTTSSPSTKPHEAVFEKTIEWDNLLRYLNGDCTGMEAAPAVVLPTHPIPYPIDHPSLQYSQLLMPAQPLGEMTAFDAYNSAGSTASLAPADFYSTIVPLAYTSSGASLQDAQLFMGEQPADETLVYEPFNSALPTTTLASATSDPTMVYDDSSFPHFSQPPLHLANDTDAYRDDNFQSNDAVIRYDALTNLFAADSFLTLGQAVSDTSFPTLASMYADNCSKLAPSDCASPMSLPALPFPHSDSQVEYATNNSHEMSDYYAEGSAFDDYVASQAYFTGLYPELDLSPRDEAEATQEYHTC